VSRPEVFAVVGVAVVVFASTNIDDLVLLSVFLADDHLRVRSVVFGQFAGIGALVAASAVCAAASVAIPRGWTALLGVVPLGLGMWKLLALLRRRAEDARTEERVHEKEARAEKRTRSQVMAVALVTAANGGDNLAVYIPLFAKDPAAVPIYTAVFAAMTGLWCAVGYWLVSHRVIGAAARRYGRTALPLVLVALGLYILADARPWW